MSEKPDAPKARQAKGTPEKHAHDTESLEAAAQAWDDLSFEKLDASCVSKPPLIG